MRFMRERMNIHEFDIRRFKEAGILGESGRHGSFL